MSCSSAAAQSLTASLDFNYLLELFRDTADKVPI